MTRPAGGGPKRVQRQRTRGWRTPAGAVYVGRPTKWGNPYIIGRVGDAHEWTGWYVGDARDDRQNYGEYDTRAEAAHRSVELFREQVWLLAADARRELAGRDLVCWCPPEFECHADVLLELANQPEPGAVS